MIALNSIFNADKVMPLSILHMDAFKLPEEATAKKLLESGLLDFHKKMLCLDALTPTHQKIREETSTSTANIFSGIAKIKSEELAATELKNIPLTTRYGEAVFKISDLQEAKEMLQRALEKGILSMKYLLSNPAWLSERESLASDKKLSKEEFNTLSEEEQLKYLNELDTRKKMKKEQEQKIAHLSKQLVEFWKVKVDFLEKLQLK